MTNMVVICGGRGSKQLIQALETDRSINLSLVINAYDDGLSTGVLRKLIPNFLGVSDFRKNTSNLLMSQKNYNNIVGELFDYRIGKFDKNSLEEIKKFPNIKHLDINFKKINQFLSKENLENVTTSIKVVSEFLLKFEEAEYCGEMSFGNLVFAGIFLQNKDFNKSIRLYNKILDVSTDIINASNGQNLNLRALLENDKIIGSEAEIVGEMQDFKIKDLELCDLSKERNLKMFQRSANVDYANIASFEAINSIQKADVIIYGSGTLHSSIYPTLLILNSYIKQNRHAIKIMIENLNKDTDINNFTTQDILDSFCFYMKDKENKYSLNYILRDRESEFKIVESISDLQMVKPIIICDEFRSKTNADHHNGYKLWQEIKNIKNSIDSDIRIKLIVLLRDVPNNRKKDDFKTRFIDAVVNYNSRAEVYFVESRQADLNDVFLEFPYSPDDKINMFILIIEKFINFNLHDVITGLSQVVIKNKEMVNINFTRSYLSKIDNINLTKIYKKNRFLIRISKYFSNILRFMIYAKYDTPISDPLGSIQLYNYQSLWRNRNKFLKLKKNNIAILLTIISEKEIVMESPIEYFDYSRKGIVNSRISRAIQVFINIFWRFNNRND